MRITGNPTVANEFKVGEGGGQFTTIKSAVIAANAVASGGGRATVIVAPGDYTEDNPITLADGVSISCPGRHEVTRMLCSNSGAHGIVVGGDTEVSGLQVRDASGVGFAGFHIPAGTNDVDLHDCKTRDCYDGVRNDAGAGASHSINIREFTITNGSGSSAVRTTTGGSTKISDLQVDDNVTLSGAAVVSDGANACSFVSASVAEGALIGDGLLAQNGGEIRVGGFACNGAVNGAHIGAGGGTILGTGLDVQGGTGSDILLDTAAATFRCGGRWDNDNVSIFAGAIYEGSFLSEGSQSGTNTEGELWLGNETEAVPLSTYTRTTGSSGWRSGGVVTVNAGRVLDVTSGDGFVNTGTGIVFPEWSPDQVTADADSDFWIYVTSAGTITIATSAPATNTNIVLAAGHTNATDVVLLSKHIVDISLVVSKLHDWLLDNVGMLWVTGLAVTEHGAPSLQFAVDAGTFYAREELKAAAVGTGPITLTRWYSDGGAGWIQVTAQNSQDPENYDGGAGSLTAVTAGWWTRPALYVSVGADGTAYHLVYATTQHATQGGADAAALPAAPSIFSTECLIVAGSTVQQGTTNIVAISDERPVITPAGPGSVAAPADHGGLTGLADDDHLGYVRLSGGAARNAITGVLAVAGGSIILPVSAAPTQTTEGEVKWDSDDDLLTVGDGTARKTMVDLAGTQTLQNKTLTQPTISDQTNAGHNHSNAAGGGELSVATETRRGAVELATQTEVNTGTDPALSITPATLSGRTATATRTGIVELATQAEVNAGTDTSRVVTPATLAATTLRGSDIAEADGTINTTSATDVIATGMANTPSAGTYLVWFSGSVGLSANNSSAHMSIHVDGAQEAESEREASRGGGATAGQVSCFMCLARVTVSGAEQIEGRWRVDSGTASMVVGRTLILQRVVVGT